MRRLVHLPLAVSTCVWEEALISLLCLHVSSFVHFHLSVSCLFGFFSSFFSHRRRCRLSFGICSKSKCWKLNPTCFRRSEIEFYFDRVRPHSLWIRSARVDCWIRTHERQIECQLLQSMNHRSKTVINIISQSLCVEQWVGRPFTRHSRARKSSSRTWIPLRAHTSLMIR